MTIREFINDIKVKYAAQIEVVKAQVASKIDAKVEKLALDKQKLDLNTANKITNK